MIIDVPSRSASGSRGYRANQKPCYPLPLAAGVYLSIGGLWRPIVWRTKRGCPKRDERFLQLSHDIMTVDPDFLAMAISPMSSPPHVIGMSHVITRAVGIVWSIANLDGDRARITRVVGPAAVAAVVGAGITRVGAIIAFTTYCAERGGN